MMMRFSLALMIVLLTAGILSASLPFVSVSAAHAGESLWFLNKDQAAESPDEVQTPEADETNVQDTEKLPVVPVIITAADGTQHVFKAEVAATVPQLQMGLMYRTQLADDEGMLFVFPYPAVHSFWMKNTLIPLDMLFIRDGGKIHHIHHNAVPEDETKIPSRGAVSFVFEIKGGMAEKLGIQEGDMADIPVKWVSEPPPRPEQMAE